MKKLKNKNCLITGAASGIGRSLAIGLAREGMNLFISDIDMERLENVKKELEQIGVKVFIGKCDVSKYEDFVELAKEFHSRLGEIDLLINNAGIGGGGFVEDISLEEWKHILDINLWGVIHSIKVFLPRMLERGSGHIVNTGSAAGIIGLSCHLQYVASKFAVVGISEGLYSELNIRGINVSVICPTGVKSNIIDKSTIEFPSSIVIEEINDINGKSDDFKRTFWKNYMEKTKGSTPEDVAKKYIKGIKKNKLFIFDKRTLPIAMLIKGISKKLYRKLLRKVGKEYLALIEEKLSELGIKYKKILN